MISKAVSRKDKYCTGMRVVKLMKELDKVREGIRKRKAEKKASPPEPHVPASEEERYGGQGLSPVPVVEEFPFRRRGWLAQAVMASLLFFVVTFLYHGPVDSPKEVEAFVAEQLNREFPFAKVTAVYQNRLGQVFPADEEAESVSSSAPSPLDGSIQVSGEGLRITPAQEGSVVSVKDGTVIFAGKKKESGPTVIVQHADGTESVYGNLSGVRAHLYQYVEQGEAIAEVEDDLYFARKEGEVYLDPYEVIEVNE